MDEKNLARLTSFALDHGRFVGVGFMELLQVAPGVECYTYRFIDDSTQDLAIVRVRPGCRTPLQRVLKGTKTLEGYMNGRGKLLVGLKNGETKVYTFPDASNEKVVSVKIGQTMQWMAMPDTELLFYEICEPPYEEGRYENLP